MTTPSSQVVAIPPDAGYAPGFAVHVEGQPVDVQVQDDVLEIHVVHELDQMASFEITFNNWDDKYLRFKYSESEASKELFKISRLVAIKLGYAGQLVPVVSGQITSLSPAFPQSGSPTIRISGTDALQKLKDSKPRPGQQVYYKDKKDWEIVQQVAQRVPNNMKVYIPDRTGPVYHLVVQKNQDDASFLMERAKRIDYDCYVESDTVTGTQTLHFQPPADGRNGTTARVFRLAYGPGLAAEQQRATAAAGGRLLPNLIEFTPTLTAAAQVSRLTVRGWDPRTKRSISATATADDLPSGQGGGLTGPTAATEALGGREETVIDAPVASVEEARNLAIALLRERAYQFITGTGRIAGLPDLRVRNVLEIHGIGLRFSGNYYVTRVEHTLSSSGFFTGFRARRIADGSHG
jgi:Bacteriophage probable baseplate hub protein